MDEHEIRSRIREAHEKARRLEGRRVHLRWTVYEMNTKAFLRDDPMRGLRKVTREARGVLEVRVDTDMRNYLNEHGEDDWIGLYIDGEWQTYVDQTVEMREL